jgi:hypothetical protein
MAGLAARKLYGRDEEKRPHDKAQAAAFSELLRRLNLGDPPTFEDADDSDDEEGADIGAQDLPEERHHRSAKSRPPSTKPQSVNANMSKFISPSGMSGNLTITKHLLIST